MKKIILQKLCLADAAVGEGAEEMLYRGKTSISCVIGAEKDYILQPDYYDFLTYFNSLPLKKWTSCCAAETIYLELDIKGDFELDLMGHYQGSDGAIHKEWLGKYAFTLQGYQHISIPIPTTIASEVVAFQLLVFHTASIRAAYYSAEIPEKAVCSPKISVSLKGANGDDRRKTERFLRQKVLADPDMCAFFSLAEGKETGKTTHRLTLDSKAFYTEESFRRICALLCMQEPEHSKDWILGMELDLNRRNHVLPETLEEDYDLNRWDDVIRCENALMKAENSSFRCVPVGSENTAPETCVTMNGICCWQSERVDEEDAAQPKDKQMLQKLLVDSAAIWDGTQPMYYRSDAKIVRSMDSAAYVMPAAYYDFSTYFNSFSLGKWKRYTNSYNWSLELEMKGSFQLDMMGHYVDSIGNIHKEWLGNYSYDLKKKTHLSIPIPAETSSIVVAFQITARSECRFYDGWYAAEARDEDIRDPFITLATTTFKKEEYVRKNIKILESTIFSDPDLAPHFSWKIVDNGSTLDPKAYNTDYLEIIPNRNVGGSGGFCCGMIEALKQKKKPTHVLLMDDDVYFMAESFRRVYMLLKLLKPQYDDYFISGAMLEINQRNIQHEDVGMFRLSGEHGPSKPRYDLNLWDSPIRNEVELKADGHQYSGWWYCCVPTTIAREDNLPLPFFIRGDDVEYSIRNHARFITMNGICIWHEGFGAKFSGAMELYQVHRNDLILQTMNDHIADIQVIDRIKNLFWEEMFKFNYKGCGLLLDAVEDFLKGPDFLKRLDGEACMKEHKAKDNQLQPITDEVRQYINYETLYQSAPLTGLTLKLYGHFVNGQKLPEFLCGKKVAVIPYGWGYSQEKLYRAGTVYAVDPINDLYVEYKRDRRQYRELTERYNRLMSQYETEYEQVAEAFRKDEKEMESKKFWIQYLNS